MVRAAQVVGQHGDRSVFESDTRYTTGKLVIGSDGICWIKNQLQRQTVRWVDLVASLEWGDGSRTIIGADGTAIRVNPWSWTVGDGAVGSPGDLIDQTCPPGLTVQMGPGNGPPRDRVRRDFSGPSYAGQRCTMGTVRAQICRLHRGGVRIRPGRRLREPVGSCRVRHRPCGDRSDDHMGHEEATRTTLPGRVADPPPDAPEAGPRARPPTTVVPPRRRAGPDSRPAA